MEEKSSLSPVLRAVLHPAVIATYVASASLFGFFTIRKDVLQPQPVSSISTPDIRGALSELEGRNKDLVEQNRILVRQINDLSDKFDKLDKRIPEFKDGLKVKCLK